MPAKKAANGRVTAKKAKKVSSVAQWKSGGTTELEVPSGNVCLVKKPDGIQAFMVDGKIPNSLMPLVEEALAGNKEGQIDMKAIASDPDKLADLFKMIDTIAINVVVDPKIHPVPMIPNPLYHPADNNSVKEIEGPRDSEKLYVDEVIGDDKLFIMSWAMSGVQDLEQFRQATTSNVATMVDVAGLEDHPLIVVGNNDDS